jgi:TRAP-type C4-dicarboxylate transport system permease small subunit
MDVATEHRPSRFADLTKSVSKWLEIIGAVAFVAMFVTTCVDVIGAKLFAWPLTGSTEIVSMLQVVAIAGCLAFSKIDNRHIIVDFIVNNLSRRARGVFNTVAGFLGLGLFTLIAWQSLKYGLTLFNNQQVTTSARIPVFPFPIWIFVCSIILCLVLIVELTSSIREAVRK